MRVLVTNDDGYDAPGLAALVRAFEPHVEVVVVAPERQQSAQSHAFTLHKPLRVTEHAPGRLSLSGTPADCAYAGIHGLVDPPDFVVSGINHGPNLGSDVHYSGTVAAAREAVLQGVPSIAASLVAGQRSDPLHWQAAADWVLRIARVAWERGLPTGTFLNVNVPNRPTAHGVRVAGLGYRNYAKSIESRTDPRGNRYVWLGGRPADTSAPPEGDVRFASEGYVTVTPLHTDPTSPSELLDGWF